MANNSLPNPLLAGTWITQDEDSDAAFVIAIENGEFRVSGFCRSDGEPFSISHIEWNKTRISFEALMPSTNTRTRNVLTIRHDGLADLELTLFEVWKKKDVEPGHPPEAWSTCQD